MIRITSDFILRHILSSQILKSQCDNTLAFLANPQMKRMKTAQTELRTGNDFRKYCSRNQGRAKVCAVPMSRKLLSHNIQFQIQTQIQTQKRIQIRIQVFFLYLFPGQLGRIRQGFRHMLW